MSGMKRIECAQEGCHRYYDGEDYGVVITWHCRDCELENSKKQERGVRARPGRQDKLDMSKLSPRQQMGHWRNRR